MAVGPAHRGLDDLVQRTERHHGRHLQLAPDERFDMKKFHAQRGNFASRGSRRSSVSIHAASIAVPGAWWDRRKTGRTGPGSLSGGLAWRGRWDQRGRRGLIRSGPKVNWLRPRCCRRHAGPFAERQSFEEGMSVAVRETPGGRRNINKQKK